MSFRFIFLGSGTSQGVPIIGHEYPPEFLANPKNHRTRPSIYVATEEVKLVVDTTPEFRVQCLRENIRWLDAVVFTHAHADHIMGLDDVRRFNALENKSLDVWADKRTHDALQRSFPYAFKDPEPHPKFFRPCLIPRLITEPFEIGPAKWIPVPLLHGDLPILGFRI